MDALEVRRQRVWAAALTALASVAGMAVVSTPVNAASGEGMAAIVLAEHDRGRTLSGQGVRLRAGAPATKTGRTLTLPISNVDPGATASAAAEGSLTFKRGKRSVALTGLRFNLTAGSLSGNLGGEQLDVLELGAAGSANASSGAVGLDAGKLRLTPEAVSALKDELGLRRALRRDGVGMAWLAAKANPTHEAAKAVSSGVAEWGFLASWRSYVLSQFGPPSSIGTITVEGGATANGDLKEAGGFLGFPAAGGSYEKGLYGASDKLSLSTQGSVVFAKPGHCIIEVKVAGLEIELNGASSKIVLDADYDVDTPAGKTCVPQPPVSNADVPFASLDLSGVTPTYSADGTTVTWSAIPAALSAAGSTALLGGKYPEGQPLDPVTISVGIG
jgi:Htaa